MYKSKKENTDVIVWVGVRDVRNERVFPCARLVLVRVLANMLAQTFLTRRILWCGCLGFLHSRKKYLCGRVRASRYKIGVICAPSKQRLRISSHLHPDKAVSSKRALR